MIDEIDYFPKRDRHNKKKKVDSEWGDLKKQKTKQEENRSDESPFSEKKPHGKKRDQQKLLRIVYTNISI